MIPVVEKMEVFPVAGHDSMELNLSGAHAPYFTRNIVILTDSNGVEGVGEVGTWWRKNNKGIKGY